MRNVKKTTVLALVSLIFGVGSAVAADGIATGNVNVRTGPGVSFSKVDSLYTGESVNIGECQSGWCYVEHDGPDGWVSAGYLQPTSGSGSGSGSSGNNCHVHWVIGQGFTVECDGNTVTIPGPGNPPPQPPPPATVCVYQFNNYGGAHLCGPVGSSQSNLIGFWNNRISSIKVSGGAHIKLCQDPNYLGFCNTFANNVPILGLPLNGKASSYQTW